MNKTLNMFGTCLISIGVFFITVGGYDGASTIQKGLLVLFGMACVVVGLCLITESYED